MNLHVVISNVETNVELVICEFALTKELTVIFTVVKVKKWIQ